MKELSIEQKAKAYDKALDRAKKVHKYSSDLAEIKRMEHIFPELKESEDETLRKWLIRYFEEINDEIDVHLRKKIITWLEKQAEKPQGKSALEAIKEKNIDNSNHAKTADNAEPKNETHPLLSDFFNAEYKRGKADALQSIEWSEEDESMYIRTLGILGKCYMGELPTKVEEELNWFKTLKERIGR